ncbi:MAG TPA: nucleotidyltransferase domain-containing protein [Actinomycetota bacterium]|nr:nucleotidyltransferase domain-containing protein [Actinomycetota bacterium]
MGRAERATAARHIGARVARARRRAGMTQATLASLVSLDRTALSRIESGQRHLRPHELARIAEALGRSVDWFLSGPLPAAQDTMTLLRTRRPAILRTVRRHGGRSVRVFGSVARGEATQESDIDLLVDMEPDRGLLDQAAMIAELTDLLGRPVDVVTPGALRPGVRERVLAEARPL